MRGPHSPRRARAGRAGFTILEILIAVVILVLGISGIIALFPTAIESGNKTVEDSYAAAITQSVIDAISVGVREATYRTQADSNGNAWTYFIFDHDGVFDPMAPTPQDYQSSYMLPGGSSLTVSQADWCILLPKGKNPNANPAMEPVFNYPSVRSFDLLGGGVDNRDFNQLGGIQNSPQAYDDWDPTRYMRKNYKGEIQTYIRRVYSLGRYRKGQEKAGFGSPPTAPGSIRDEFLGELLGPPITGDASGNRATVDPYPQYSFAIAIRRSKIDNVTDAGGSPASGPPTPDGLITQVDNYSDNLYEVHVFVFRNFDTSPSLHANLSTNSTMLIPRTCVPIREFVTLMSM